MKSEDKPTEKAEKSRTATSSISKKKIASKKKADKKKTSEKSSSSSEKLATKKSRKKSAKEKSGSKKRTSNKAISKKHDVKKVGAEKGVVLAMDDEVPSSHVRKSSVKLPKDTETISTAQPVKEGVEKPEADVNMDEKLGRNPRQVEDSGKAKKEGANSMIKEGCLPDFGSSHAFTKESRHFWWPRLAVVGLLVFGIATAFNFIASDREITERSKAYVSSSLSNRSSDQQETVEPGLATEIEHTQIETESSSNDEAAVSTTQENNKGEQFSTPSTLE